MSRLISCLLLFLVTLGPFAAAEAQNLVDGTFDTNLDGWFAPPPSNWSAVDSSGASTSGSALLTNQAGGPFTYISLVSDCVLIDDQESYRGSYRYLFPTGQSRTGELALSVGWYSSTDCSGYLGTSFQTAVGDQLDGQWHDTGLGQPVVPPVGARSANVRIDLSKLEAGGSLQAHVDDIVFGAGDSCLPSATAMCLLDERFRVEVEWQTPQGNAGSGMAERLTSDSGYFWFFNRDNIELVVKVLAGCPVNDRFWVFMGGLTNVAVDVTITDTETGTVESWSNSQSTPFQPIQDTNAFATCP